jgi:2-amino-4-hydroxy-6-hydroxymethyldihydropteridine diphosphokinase
MKQAVLSFVSCSGKREDNIRGSVRAAECLPETTVLAKSEFYETQPQRFGRLEYGCVSACAVILTGMRPDFLYGACAGIAAALGGDPDVRKDAAAIQICLLIYDGVHCRDGELILPNRDLLKLPWILRPLSELFQSGKALDCAFDTTFLE